MLLVWLALGFFADAATLELQRDALADAGAQDIPEVSGTEQLAAAGIGLVALSTGLVLLVRPPGPPKIPEDAETGAPDIEDGPRRCWRCRAKWPQGADACPECGAERLR